MTREQARDVARGAALVAVPALLVLWCIALVGHLAIFTEARYLLDGGRSIDPLRYALLPQLAWGDSRLTGLATFTLVGGVCGTSPECANLAAAGLTLVAALLVLLHAWQVLRSVAFAVVALLLWGFSPSLLSIWIWHPTWYDLLACILALASVSFWWWAFARPSLSMGARVGVSLVSVLLLMVAFNAKEIDYHLVGVIILLAVVRGATVDGGIQRNLWLTVLPLLYAAWFIGKALLTIDPTYAAETGRRPIIDGLSLLITQALGTSRHFSFLDQQSPLGDAIRNGTAWLFSLFGLALGAAGIVAALRARPWRRPASFRALLIGWGTEGYLLAIIVVTLVMGARSSGASAYYTVIPRWAALLLVLLLIRRAARSFSRPAWVSAGLVALLAAAGFMGYAGDLAPGATAPRLVADSATWRATLATIDALLDGRDVTNVHWRVDGQPVDAFYLVRDPAQDQPGTDEPWQPGTDIWRWVVGGDPQVTVEPLLSGTAAEWAARAGEMAGPGEVLIVTTPEHRLALLAHEGRVLFRGPETADAGTAP
ncbi:MAG: hypothetical protein U0869_21555 [Chloroflexota bacterium]